MNLKTNIRQVKAKMPPNICQKVHYWPLQPFS